MLILIRRLREYNLNVAVYRYFDSTSYAKIYVKSAVAHAQACWKMETQKSISTSDCLYKLQEIIDEPSRPKRQKLGTFENACKILQMCNVSINEQPVEKVSTSYLSIK